MCSVKGLCGYNSFCTRNDGEPICICLPGFHFKDLDSSFSSCERSFESQRCINDIEDLSLHNKTLFYGLYLDDHPYFVASMSEKENYSQSCWEDCIAMLLFILTQVLVPNINFH